MTAIIPSTQDTELDLRATNAKEFRELLGRIRDSAGLSGGQVATKTGMPRSTAYALTDTNRPGLPSNEDQIRAFVQACGLTATQVDNVRDLWLKLYNEQEDAKNAAKAADTRARLTSNGQPLTVTQAHAAATEWLTGVVLHDGYPDPVARDAAAKFLQLGWTPTRPCDQRPKRATTPLDLLHYILADEDRYQRALTLVKLLSVLAIVVVAGVVGIAVLVPSTATYLGTGLVAVLIVAAGALNGKHLRTRRPKGASPQ